MIFAKNVIFVLLCIVTITSIISSCFLEYHFAHNLPDHPQPELHRTYPLNIHGWIVYLTRGEKVLRDCLALIFFSAGILAVLLGLFVFGGESLGTSLIERSTEINRTEKELSQIIKYHFRLLSPLSIGECRTRLKSAIDIYHLSLLLSGYAGSKPLLGKIRGDNFRLQKRVYYGNSFRYIFYGRFISSTDGTVIEGKFRMHPFIKVFLMFWFSFLILFFIMVCTSFATGRMQNWGISILLIIIAIGMAALGTFIVKFGWRLGMDDEKYIVAFLKNVLEANENDLVLCNEGK